MKKEEWLQKINRQLMSSESREKVIEHYEELFSIAKENGKNEEELIDMLNHPDGPGELKPTYHKPLNQRFLLKGSLLFIGLFIVMIAMYFVFF